MVSCSKTSVRPKPVTESEGMLKHPLGSQRNSVCFCVAPCHSESFCATQRHSALFCAILPILVGPESLLLLFLSAIFGKNVTQSFFDFF